MTAGKVAPHVLSIAIPTYDRNEQLLETLRGLLPQLRDQIATVHILDNCSPTPVADTLASGGVSGNSVPALEIHRHPANLGLAANVIRCFEVAEGAEWLWVLGDDDAPMGNAIDLIHRSIAHLQELPSGNAICHIKFDSCYASPARSPRILHGSTELALTLANKDNYSNFLFLSSGVYRRNVFLNASAYGYRAANTLAPHIAMLLHCVDQGGKILRYPGEVVTTSRGIKNASWDHFTLRVGFQSFLDNQSALVFQNLAMPPLMRNYSRGKTFRAIARNLASPAPRSRKFWMAYYLKAAIITGGLHGTAQVIWLSITLLIVSIPGIAMFLSRAAKPRSATPLDRT